ncbi:LacI family DNA-binding transcriptional regulator [Enterococcus faecium]|nr:LacI family DNA-binding transcriptional regulator [Enterococcus faecium]
MKPTIYDIAKKANVSKSTVSRVLNNQPNISDKAKASVLQAIKELNYEPSKIARGLSGNGFDAILALSHRTSHTTYGNPFFSDVIQSISAVSEQNNFDLILQTAKTPEEELEKCAKKIQEKMIRGIIILSSTMDETLLFELDQYNIPIVVIGKVGNDYTNIYSVDTDNFQDSYDLVETLIKNGHRHIGCLHAPTEVYVSNDRLNGYRQCLFDHHLDIRNEWIIDGGFRLEDSMAAMNDLMKLRERPTAIFSTDALKSLSIYKVAEQSGKQIPDDLSIAGFSDPLLSSLFSPQLTRIDIPTNQLGIKATELLFQLIHHQYPEEKESFFQPRLLSQIRSNNKKCRTEL